MSSREARDARRETNCTNEAEKELDHELHELCPSRKLLFLIIPAKAGIHLRTMSYYMLENCDRISIN
ncbi:hypothetical protein HY772_03390 [Candidatus Woesearchaeota archaeon]|nr:hypothetical protein [Candidatus Woesearchaeota archaeon]